LATIQSCHKDDGVFVKPDTISDTKTDTNGTDTDTKTTDTDGDEHPDDDSGIEGDDGEITTYFVVGDDLIKDKDYKVTGKALEFQKDTLKHQEIWELAKKIIPLGYRSKMSHFAIYAGEKNESAGYVFNTTEDLSKWEMGIAIDFAYDNGTFNYNGQLAYTIIHEFGHILTLNDTQVDASVFVENCKNFHTGEGCSKNQSHINILYSKYWADIWKAFVKAGDNQIQQEEFYNKHEDRFVTRYASTNPGEDIAEIFATFVTRKGGVRGKSIAEQKIGLLYDSPELVGIRNYIRDNFTASKSRNYLPIAGTWKNANSFGDPKKIHCTKHSR